jgi:hypothetical protein
VLGTLIVVLGVIAIGAGVGDRMRIKQEELILQKLPVAAASEFYDSLVRRQNKTRWLRAAALGSVWVLLYLWRRHFFGADR